MICSLHLQFYLPSAILSSIPFVSNDPFFVFFAAIVSIRSVFCDLLFFPSNQIILNDPASVRKILVGFILFLFYTNPGILRFFLRKRNPALQVSRVRRAANQRAVGSGGFAEEETNRRVPFFDTSLLYLLNIYQYHIKKRPAVPSGSYRSCFSYVPAQPPFMFDTRRRASARCKAARDRM